jgi:acetolactate synthase-1/2/3 large subunit
VLDMLAGYGVTHVFMVPAVLRRTFAEMERRTKIARIHCHGEKSAAYMADGYARASGKPGVCMAQVIGALNLAAGLRDAYLAHSPVIAMTGGRDPKTKFRKVYQEIDDVPAFEPVTKMNVTIDDVARIPDMVRQAFRTATTGAPGPVHLQFRGNEGQVDLEEAEMNGLVEAQFSRVPPFRPEPEAAHVKAALELLQKAERPIIVAGGGARASGAGKELVALAEALQIPIASLNGRTDRRASVVSRRGRQLFARKRQPCRECRRPCLLHRHGNRRDDDAFLGRAENRHAGDPDRHRARGARP